MAHGFLYLVAVMDWFSRFVLSWSLSLTVEIDFCIAAPKSALRRGRPEIFNSDQGSYLKDYEPVMEARAVIGSRHKALTLTAMDGIQMQKPFKHFKPDAADACWCGVRSSTAAYPAFSSSVIVF